MDRRQVMLQGILAFGACSGLGLLGAASSVRAQTRTFQIGVLPNVSARIISTQYEPMQAHLNQKLDMPVQVSTASDWGAFYRNVKADQYDMVVSAIHVARLFQLDFGLRPIATYQPNIKALLISKKGQPELTQNLTKTKEITVANPASLVAMEGERMLERTGLRSGADFKYSRVRGDDSVGITVVRGDAAAGILSMGEFNAHPAEVKEQLEIVKVFAEVPSFTVLTSKRLSESMGSSLSKQLAAFSEASAEGKLFEQRTGFRIMAQVNDKDLIAMDAFAEKTRRLLG